MGGVVHCPNVLSDWKLFMKKRLLLFLLASLTLSAVATDERLLTYQKRYSVCNKTNDYQITECLLNGNLNFSMFRGDRRAFRYLSPQIYLSCTA